MRILPFVQLIVANAILLYIFAWITSEYAARTAYWLSEGFTPSTTRLPFFMITSAVRSGVSIPGTLTVDWQQIVALVIVIMDLVYLWSAIRSK